MGSPTIFSGNNTKSLKPNLDLAGNVTINSGALDPTSVAVSANLGSLYISTSTGLIYQKLDAGSSTNWVVLGQGANVTDWVAYTPTFTGFGSVSGVDFSWRRIGDTLVVSGSVVAGTPTGVEARISLPNGVVIDAGKITSTRSVGDFLPNNPGTFVPAVLANGGLSYFTFGVRDGSNSPLTNQLGSAIISGGNDWTMMASVPISGWTSAVTVTRTAPLITTYTSGSGTHTLTGSPLYIRVRMVGGGGGGGGGGGNSSTAGGDGGDTTFGTTLLVAGKGFGGAPGTTAAGSGAGGSGGTASLGSGPTGTSAPGAAGSYGNNGQITGDGGQPGGSSPFGGAGGGSSTNVVGGSAIVNSGSGGGGGGGGSASGYPGGSGGAGGFIDAIISSPAASYSYAVGAAGTAGAGNGGGNTGEAGGAGGSGYIEVTEYYQ